MKREQGFTLIEIAIVLVIIGLLLGGVLKGQELITSARVRNLISTQDGIKAAYFGFLDRYRALPGDYSAAVGNISGVSGSSPCSAEGRIYQRHVYLCRHGKPFNHPVKSVWRAHAADLRWCLWNHQWRSRTAQSENRCPDPG